MRLQLLSLHQLLQFLPGVFFVSSKTLTRRHQNEGSGEGISIRETGGEMDGESSRIDGCIDFFRFHRQAAPVFLLPSAALHTALPYPARPKGPRMRQHIAKLHLAVAVPSIGPVTMVNLKHFIDALTIKFSALFGPRKLCMPSSLPYTGRPCGGHLWRMSACLGGILLQSSLTTGSRKKLSAVRCFPVA